MAEPVSKTTSGASSGTTTSNAALNAVTPVSQAAGAIAAPDMPAVVAPDSVAPAVASVIETATPDSAHPNQDAPDERIIQGVTGSGQQFRPSDWAERLCGAMSCFRPDGYAGRNAHLVYSPYVRPTVLGGIKCVVVNEALRELQPLAYHFVMDFAKDNDLQVTDACLLPEPRPVPPAPPFKGR